MRRVVRSFSSSRCPREHSPIRIWETAVEAYAELLSRMGRTEEQILATLREDGPGQFS